MLHLFWNDAMKVSVIARAFARQTNLCAIPKRPLPCRYISRFKESNVSCHIEGNIQKQKNQILKTFVTLLKQIEHEPLGDSRALTILKSCMETATDEEHREPVEMIWLKLKEKGIKLNEHHYISMMKFYDKIGDTNGVVRIFDEMKAAGLMILPVAYQTVLQSYCQDGNIEKVLEWLKNIDEANFFLSEVSFNKVAQCYLRNGDLEMANKTVDEMQENSFSMNIFTVIEFLKLYAAKGDSENIEKTLNACIAANINLRNKNIISVIYDLVENGHEQNIEKFINYMNPNDMGEQFVRAVITRFVQNGYAFIIQKILLQMKSFLYAQFLIDEMVRLNAPATDISQAIAKFDEFGINVNKNTNAPSKSTQVIPMKGVPIGNIDDSNYDEQFSHNEWQNIRQMYTIGTSGGYQSEESRFHTFIKEGNITEIESLLERGKLNMTNSKYAQVIELYTSLNNLGMALKTLNEALKSEKNFKLNPVHLAKLVALMIDKNYDFERIKEILYLHRSEKPAHRLFTYETIFERLANEGNDELLNELYDAIIENNLIEETTNLATPLVTVHLTKGDLLKSVEVYEKIVTTKNLTPHTFGLMQELIEKDELKLLQRVYKVYEKVRNVSEAQYRLAFAYIECGHEEEAQKIFKSGQIKNLSPKIAKHCLYLEKFNKVELAQVLLKVTKGVRCDRSHIYRTLLEFYCKNDHERGAIDLWKEFKAEGDSKLLKDFSKRLIRFLEAKKADIPDELRQEAKFIKTSKH